MFGVKRLRERFDVEFENIHRRVNSLDEQTAAALSRDRFANAQAVGNLRVDVMREIHRVSDSVNALAAALGYEWVPEGKTKAEWRRKPGPWDIDWDGLPKLDIRVKPKCEACDRMAAEYAKLKVESEINAGRKKGGKR